MPTVVMPGGEWPVPYGYPQSVTLYINGDNEYDLSNFKIVQKLNQMSLFEADLFDVTRSDTNIQVGNIVMFFGENTLILKGVIQKVTYSTDGYAHICGEGMEEKLLQKEISAAMSSATYYTSDTKRAQFNNTNSSTIVNQICSTNGTGVAPWDLQPLINTNYGAVTMRFENVDKLTAVSNLALALVSPITGLGYDWWISQSDDFATDYFNIGSRGSATSVMTFDVSGANQNANTSDRQDDMDNIANYVVYQGYGDGINQLKTSCFNSSPIYSFLASAITTTTATISLTDASTFASSGTIIIMEEQITYSGKTGNNLTGCTRGANSTTARAHPLGVYIQKYVVATTPEVNSSINTYGRQEKTFQDATVIDLQTLELNATRVLMERLNPITRITLDPSDIFDTLTTAEVGDVITVTDADAGLSGTYRYVGFTFQLGDDQNYVLEMEVNNVYIQLLQQVQQINQSATNQAVVMQGATNIYCVNSYENADSSKALYVRFYIPNDAVAINSIKLTFKLKNFRGYQQIDPSASYTAVSSGVNTDPGLSYTSAFSGVVNVKTDAYYDISTLNVGSGTHGMLTACSMAVKPQFVGANEGQNYYVRLYNSTDGTYSPDATGVSTTQIDDQSVILGGTCGFTLWIAADTANKTIKLQEKAIVENGNTATSGTWLITGQHTHSTTVGSHTHSTSYGILENSISNPSTVVTCGLSSTEDSNATVGTYTSDQTDVDLTSFISSGAGNWYTVKMTANQAMRIEANVFVKVFIQSR